MTLLDPILRDLHELFTAIPPQSLGLLVAGAFLFYIARVAKGVR